MFAPIYAVQKYSTYLLIGGSKMRLAKHILLHNLQSHTRAGRDGILDKVFDDATYMPTFLLEEGILYACRTICGFLHDDNKLGKGGVQGYRDWRELTNWAIDTLLLHAKGDEDFDYWLMEWDVNEFEFNMVIAMASEVLMLASGWLVDWDLVKIDLDEEYSEVEIHLRQRLVW